MTQEHAIRSYDETLNSNLWKQVIWTLWDDVVPKLLKTTHNFTYYTIYGLGRDCGHFIADVLKFTQSWTKPSLIVLIAYVWTVMQMLYLGFKTSTWTAMTKVRVLCN